MVELRGALEAIKELEARELADASPGGPYQIQRLRGQIGVRASRISYQGDVLWARSDPQGALACAWSYALAGEFAEAAGFADQAAEQYHYAAHQFRHVDALGASFKYYRKSSAVASEGSTMKVRSLLRAAGLAPQIGEVLGAVESTALEAIRAPARESQQLTNPRPEE